MTTWEKADREKDQKPSEAVAPELARPRFAKGTLDLAAVRLLDDDRELAAIPDAVFRIDANGRIEDVNALAESLVGYARSELVGQTARTVLADLPRPAERTRFLHDAVAVHRAGLSIPITLLLCPHERGSMLAIARRSAREDIEQLVHDLKSPLTTIALEAELLGDGAIDRARATVAVNRIARNVGFLDRMLQDLLDLAAMESDRFTIRRSPTELRELVVQVIDRVVATRDRPRVFLHAPEAITTAIDDLRIERVIANLISNALKYAPPASGVVVRVEQIPGCARVAVIDAGPGIPVAQRAAIFDKYRRLQTTHTGCGLGLYVSKRIVEAHGGRIGVDSIHGTGSQFFFELPTE